MTSSDPAVAPFTIEEAIELVKDGRSWRQFAQVQTMLLGASVELDEETMDRLSGAFLDGREKTLAEYAKGIRESIGAAPLALVSEPDGEKLSDWAGAFHPDRLGYRSHGFHEADIEIVIGMFASNEDPIAAGYRYTTSLEILQEEAKKDDELAPFAREQFAAAMLEAELGTHLRKVHEVARLVARLDPKSEKNAEEVVFNKQQERDRKKRQAQEHTEEMSFLDLWFASHVERLGESGKDLAKRVRTEAKALWREKVHPWSLFDHWLPSGEPAVRSPKAVRNLARVLWRDVVGPHLSAARRKGPPALVMAVAEPVAHMLSRVRRDEDRNGQRSLVLPNEVIVRVGAAAASLGTNTIDALMVDRGLRLFGSLASHRVLRWQIATAHRQALEMNPDPRVLRIDGGWPIFAHDVHGMNGKKAADQVRDIIEAMHATELPLPPDGSYSRLLIREAHTPRGRGRQWIKLVLGFALMPDYVRELQEAMGERLAGRRAKRLVPIPAALPPLVGNEYHHGAQATFQMLLMAHFRDHAGELVTRGDLALSEETIGFLARSAVLPLDVAQRAIDRWSNDGEDGPALLTRKGDRYTLAPAYANELAFIIQGGRDELNGKRAGEKNARKNRSLLARRGR